MGGIRMIKPMGYDEAQAATGDFEALPGGAYVCRIMRAEDTISKTGKKMLVLSLDIAEGEHSGHFSKMHGGMLASKPSAAWPCAYRQLTEGSSLPFFKGAMTAIEESNSGYKWGWDERTLAGKLVGAVFQREEYVRGDGKKAWITVPVSIRSVGAVRAGECKAPPDKPLPKADSKSYGIQCDVKEEDLPFSFY
jgi:hypothetical protein